MGVLRGTSSTPNEYAITQLHPKNVGAILSVGDTSAADFTAGHSEHDCRLLEKLRQPPCW